MSDTILVVVKFVLGILFLPFVWAIAVVFFWHVNEFPGSQGDFFFWGAFSFLMLYLFFFQFRGVYVLGQRICTGIFKFLAPADKFMARIVPFYLVVILLLFFGMRNFLDISAYDPYFMYFAGFAFTMHVVITAQELQFDQSNFLKPEYLFHGSVFFILFVLVTVLLFDLVFGELTIQEFVQLVWNDVMNVYRLVGQKIVMK